MPSEAVDVNPQGGPVARAVVQSGGEIPINVCARVNSALGASTVLAPASAFDSGSWFMVEDSGSVAATNPITIDGNGRNINGASTFTLDVNDGRAYFILDGNEWRRTLIPRRFFPSPAPGATPSFRTEDLPASRAAAGQNLWATAADLDFTSMASADYTPVGTYEIGGIAGWVRKVAGVDSDSIAIVNGTGLVINSQRAAGTDWSATVRSAPVLWMPFAALIPYYDRDTRFRARIAFGAATKTDNTVGGGVVVAVDNDPDLPIAAGTNAPFSQGLRRKWSGVNTYINDEAAQFLALSQSSGDSANIPLATGRTLAAFETAAAGHMPQFTRVYGATVEARMDDDTLRLWTPEVAAMQSFATTNSNFMGATSSTVNSTDVGFFPDLGLALGVYKNAGTAGTSLQWEIKRILLEYHL